MSNGVKRWLSFVALLGLARGASAGELVVPVAIQVEMLGKLVGFDRGFKDRAGPQARVLVLEAPGRGESKRAAQQLKAALEKRETFGGLPQVSELATYLGPKELAAACGERHVALVYLAPGFTDDEVRAMAKALAGVNVLTAAAAASDVAAGAVVGFDLVEGKPKILVNLPQAQKQGVSFASSLLSLARVLQ
jgi:hypothetical protein